MPSIKPVTLRGRVVKVYIAISKAILRGRVARVYIAGQGGQGVHYGAGWPGYTLWGREARVYIAGQGGQPVTLRDRVARVYIAISKTS